MILPAINPGLWGMELMSLANKLYSAKPQYNSKQREIMLNIARDSILHGLKNGRPLKVNPEEFGTELQKERATFVTLNINNKLRGCIGHLEAIQPLIADVAQNAYQAAFSDPRFSVLRENEFDKLDIHISVLSKPEQIKFKDEKELLNKIQPEIDGLILEDGINRGTFLPSVWESLPEPQNFLAQLKLKAGLAPNYWSESLRVSRYNTESFS